jgi:hypothetical protein
MLKSSSTELREPESNRQRDRIETDRIGWCAQADIVNRTDPNKKKHVKTGTPRSSGDQKAAESWKPQIREAEYVQLNQIDKWPRQEQQIPAPTPLPSKRLV